MDKITITFDSLEAINDSIKALTLQNVNLKKRIVELELAALKQSSSSTTMGGVFSIAMGTRSQTISPEPDSPKCEFCLESHLKKECCYETWMDILATAPLIQPSPIFKRIRMLKNKWVVLLVPNFHPVIISRYYDYEFVALSEKDKFEIESDLSLSRFKYLYLNPTSWNNIASVNREIASWLSEQKLNVF